MMMVWHQCPGCGGKGETMHTEQLGEIIAPCSYCKGSGRRAVWETWFRRRFHGFWFGFWVHP